MNVTLTESERNHLLNLLYHDQAEGGYYGNKAQYYRRTERIIEKLLDKPARNVVGSLHSNQNREDSYDRYCNG